MSAFRPSDECMVLAGRGMGALTPGAAAGGVSFLASGYASVAAAQDRESAFVDASRGGLDSALAWARRPQPAAPTQSPTIDDFMGNVATVGIVVGLLVEIVKAWRR